MYRQSSDHGETFYSLQPFIEGKVSFGFRIIFASNSSQMRTAHVRSGTDTKWCLTSLLVTPWFSNPSTNLRDVSTRTGVLRFSKSQVLFQPGKRREYRPLIRHMQPYVTIKTIREKPPYGRGAFCCACASRILFGACCVICIFSARFRGFSTRRLTPFCNFFWRGMQENDKFTNISNFVDTRGVCWPLGWGYFNVQSANKTRKKLEVWEFGLLKIKMCRWLMANLEG